MCFATPIRGTLACAHALIRHASFSLLGAGSQVLQDRHQQRSVEAVAIPCKVALLLSALKVLCTACIPQHPSVVSVLPGWPRLLLPCVCEHWHWAVCSAERICKAWPACDAAATCSWEHVHGNRTSVHWQLLSES